MIVYVDGFSRFSVETKYRSKMSRWLHENNIEYVDEFIGQTYWGFSIFYSPTQTQDLIWFKLKWISK